MTTIKTIKEQLENFQKIVNTKEALMMNSPINFPENTFNNSINTTRREPIPALTGLRFFAACFVMIAHGTILLIKFQDWQHPATLWLSALAGIGMSLFFVESGFVIHYNYFTKVTTEGRKGIWSFCVARIARIYPLFFLILLTDLLLGANGLNRISYEDQWLWYKAIPWYLSMLQSWHYQIIGNNNLIYQIGVNLPLTWSISTECFFYFAYPLIALTLVRLRKTWVTATITVLFSLTIYFLFFEARNLYPILDNFGVENYGEVASINKFQDSFIRWVFYFSPYSRITEFILGCLICHIYLGISSFPLTAIERKFSLLIQTVAFGLLFAFYWIIFINQPPILNGPLPLVFGLAPAMAFLIFCTARYNTCINKFLSFKPILLGGKISYSIYLTHFLVLHALSQFTPSIHTFSSEIVAWIRFVFGIGIVFIISSLTYSFFEVPSRKWIRKFNIKDSLSDYSLIKIVSTFFAFIIVLNLLVKILLQPQINNQVASSLESLFNLILSP